MWLDSLQPEGVGRVATKLKVIEDRIDFLDDRLREAGSGEP
jgi:hypothetical protein